ncbi:MAG: 50S ribosomal protein L18 [Candidatus Pacearchaeota archaeon]
MKKVDKRRRREGKTDYKKRINLLKGESPRIILRKTNRYLITQYVKSIEAQDKIEIGLNSSALLEYGWPESAVGSLKSVTAAYLLGMLLGKKISDKKSVPIIDLGMLKIVHKSSIFGFIKGLIDSGIKIDTKEGIFPEESRIKGEHLKNKVPFEEIKSKIMSSKGEKAK